MYWGSWFMWQILHHLVHNMALHHELAYNINPLHRLIMIFCLFVWRKGLIKLWIELLLFIWEPCYRKHLQLIEGHAIPLRIHIERTIICQRVRQVIFFSLKIWFTLKIMLIFYFDNLIKDISTIKSMSISKHNTWIHIFD